MTDFRTMQTCGNRNVCEGCFYRANCIWREAFYFECYSSLKESSFRLDLSKKANHSPDHQDVINKFYNQLDVKKANELKKHPTYSEK